MKAELDEQGTLVVSAETSLEKFAMRHWHSLWLKDEAILQVECGWGETVKVRAPELGGGEQA